MRTAQATLLVTVKETMFSLLRLINDLRLKLPRCKRSDGYLEKEAGEISVWKTLITTQEMVHSYYTHSFLIVNQCMR